MAGRGKAALYDLMHSADVSEVIAADINFDGLQEYIRSTPYAHDVQCEQVDSADVDSLDRLLAQGFDVAIDLGDPLLRDNVATAAVRHGVSVVNGGLHDA